MALARREGHWIPAWTWLCSLLVVAHVASALSVFPNYMAYANRAWGGPENLHNLLSDANVDWAQQLYQVKAWQDRHPSQSCWFAYFAYPVIDPAVYGIHCSMLPTADTGWDGGTSISSARHHRPHLHQRRRPERLRMVQQPAQPLPIIPGHQARGLD